MAEDRQPPNVVEGAASNGDIDDETTVAKSAEDRKAAAAMSKLDVRGDDEAAPAREVDQEAVNRAMSSLGGGGAEKKAEEKKEVKKVKVDPADVTLLVDQLDLTKSKATELLKAHDGDAVRAMRAFIAVKF